MITVDRLNELFVYKDGLLIRKIFRTGHRAYAGDIAGTTKPRGYRDIKVDNKRYAAHRLIFLMFHGYLPERIDHIDGNCGNNRIENLRPTTASNNAANQKLSIKNTSGYKGVYWKKSEGKWIVSIQKNYKAHHGGTFTNKREAARAYDKLALELFGEFARLNFPKAKRRP